MKKTITIIALAFALLIFAGCGKGKELPNGAGYLPVKGGKIWYRVWGTGKQPPILLLHGGPGSPAYYLNPLLDLALHRKVIVFDQLGCGRSDRISDTALMSVDSYVEQIVDLLNFLGVRECYLYGHSWGSMLATEYFLKHPKRIRALILSSPVLSEKAWTADADSLIASLPDSLSEVLGKDLRGQPTDSAALSSSLMIYFQHFGVRKRPLSPDMDSTFTQNADNVFRYLWGNSEFRISGALKQYDRTSQLPGIQVPVLFIIGEFDEVRPNTGKYYQSLVPGSRLVTIPGAGHMNMQDNPADNVLAISSFLDSVEQH